MRRLTRTLLCLGLALGAGPAAAQARAPAEARPAIAAEARRATTLIHRMSRRSDETHRWLREARTRREGVRARCLDDKLSQLHAAERAAYTEVRRVHLAAERGVAAAANLLRLENLATRSDQLHRSAAWCGRTPVARVPTRTTVRVWIAPLPAD